MEAMRYVALKRVQRYIFFEMFNIFVHQLDITIHVSLSIFIS